MQCTLHYASFRCAGCLCKVMLVQNDMWRFVAFWSCFGAFILLIARQMAAELQGC